MKQKNVNKITYQTGVCAHHITDVIIKSIPTESDCMLVGQKRMGNLPPEYDKTSYELGFHQGYDWMLSQIFEGTISNIIQCLMKQL
ncbi:MAG: hypothetical protein M0R17_10570 [Candidatus Omnitrophica bacterium]|jgi:hypothetical protein|nr:hypothetical protein [Candidatus Omnitrophota bacterium]